MSCYGPTWPHFGVLHGGWEHMWGAWMSFGDGGLASSVSALEDRVLPRLESASLLGTFVTDADVIRLAQALAKWDRGLMSMCQCWIFQRSAGLALPSLGRDARLNFSSWIWHPPAHPAAGADSSNSPYRHHR